MEAKREASFIRRYKEMLPLSECQKFIDYFNFATQKGNVGISSGSADNGGGINRTDTAIFLDRANPDLNGVVNRVLENCWHQYVEEFSFLSNVTVVTYASKMQRTPPSGGFHMWHWEHAHRHMNRDRMAVWTLYLTTHEDEGETEFLAHGLKVPAIAGDVCIFPADYTGVHRGNPVYTKDKYIVTGWFEYAPD